MSAHLSSGAIVPSLVMHSASSYVVCEFSYAVCSRWFESQTGDKPTVSHLLVQGMVQISHDRLSTSAPIIGHDFPVVIRVLQRSFGLLSVVKQTKHLRMTSRWISSCALLTEPCGHELYDSSYKHWIDPLSRYGYLPLSFSCPDNRGSVAL